MRCRFSFPSRRVRALTRAIAVAWLVGLAGIGSAQEISPANTSRYVGGGRWEWTVFVRAAPEVVARIECVEYTLHETFPNPRRRVCAPGAPTTPFALRASGWGTFTVQIGVLLKSGETRQLSHKLRFEAPPRKPAAGAPGGTGEPLPLSATNVARRGSDGVWTWTIFLRGPPSAIAQVRCVEYRLHPTFPNPVREVCTQGSSTRPFALQAKGWGTFTVRLRVILKDGTTQELEHALVF